MAIYGVAHYLNPTLTRRVVHSLTESFHQNISKEGVKNVLGIALFAIGLTQARSLYTSWRGRLPHPQEDEVEVFRYAAILNAAVSWPGILLISTVVHLAFSPAQVERVCGTYTTFEHNPRHPRHIVSLIAFGLTLPLATGAVQHFISYVRTKYDGKLFMKDVKNALTDARFFAIISVLGSRVTLHVGHQVAQYAARFLFRK